MDTVTKKRSTARAVAKRILVVEDEGIVAIDIEKSLRELGFEVTGIAVSSEEAMHKAAELRPDLVLMDIRIQGELDGIQTAERLQRRFDVPVIYLTAHGDAETLQRAKKTAPLAFLIKPFNKLALQSSVETALFRYEMEKRLRERERWLAAAFGSAADALICVDPGACVLHMNAAAEGLTGTTLDKAAGRPAVELLRLVDEQGRALAESPVQRALDEERSTVIPEFGVALDARGTVLPCRLSVSPVKDGERLLGAVLLLEDVSEQKKLHAARESAVFRALFDEAAVGMTMIAPHSGRYVHVNEAFCRITGYNERELCGMTPLELTHPEDRNIDLSAVRSSAEDRAGYAREKRCVRKSGEIRWVRVTARLVPAAGQSLFMDVVEDITERKQAELHNRFLDELQPAMNRMGNAGELTKEVLQALARHLGVNLAVFGKVAGGAGIVTLDGEYRELVPSLAGTHQGSDYLTDEARKAILAGEDFIVEDVAADPRTARTVEAFRRLDIKAVIVVPLFSPQGLVATLSVGSREPRAWRPDEVELLHGMAARLFPAVERAKTEQALREREQLLELALQGGQAGAWEHDIETGELLWEVGVTEMLGLPRAAPGTASERWAEFVLSEDRERVFSTFREAGRQEAGTWSADYRVLRTDGAVRWCSSRAVIVSAPGRHRRFIGVVQDITERKEAEQAMREADRRKDEFLATLSHELRNPLAPLSNALQIIRRADPVLGLQALNVAERQLAHMVRLVEDLLDSSRIARGQLGIRRERMDLTDAVIHAVETSRPMIEEKGHALQIDLPQDPVPVEGDRARLAQVFSNLLNNAARYTPPGGRIRLCVGRNAQEALVEVSDTGIGIAPETVPRLFDMFSRFVRDREFTGGGLGIGLALARGITGLHGGHVDARSEGLGRGSTFSVRIPIAEDRFVAPPARVAARSPASPLRVLVADDNVDAAQSLALLLEVMGHTVRVAQDGLEAVAAATEFAPEVIFMDLGMPRLDGLEATRRIRSREAGKPAVIYALTGWGQETDRGASRQAGCDGHLVKPPSGEDLERALLRANMRVDR